MDAPALHAAAPGDPGNQDQPSQDHAGNEDRSAFAAIAFLNALLREHAGWRRLDGEAARAIDPQAQVVAVVPLPASGQDILIRIARATRAGQHRYIWPLLARPSAGAGAVRPIDFAVLVALVVAEPAIVGSLDARRRSIFLSRVHASVAAVCDIAHARAPASVDETPFIEAEADLALGHPFHPAPKGREGLDAAEHRLYAPEFRNGFALRWLAAAPAALAGDSAHAPAAELTRRLALEDPQLGESFVARLPSGSILLPVHPWQARRLLALPRVRALVETGSLRDLGEAGSPFRATASFRTIYGAHAPFMIKSSLSLRITNSLRVMFPRELGRGVQISRVLRSPIGAALRARFPRFVVIEEPAWLALRASDGSLIAESAVILRDNPFRGTAAPRAQMLATLCEPDPLGGPTRVGRVVQRLAARERQPVATIAGLWFERFLDVAVAPFLVAHADHGLLLGGHQQNLLLELADGWPARAFFRDCQGSGCIASAQARIAAQVPGFGEGTENVIADELAPRLLGYYVVVNTVLNLIGALALDGAADEADLYGQLRALVHRLHADATLDRACLAYLLESDFLWAKANLLTYLSDVNENASTATPLAPYVRMPNPLVVP